MTRSLVEIAASLRSRLDPGLLEIAGLVGFVHEPVARPAEHRVRVRVLAADPRTPLYRSPPLPRR